LLLEGLQYRGQFCVLIGFGANIVSAPEGTPYPARALVSQTNAPTPAALLKELSDCWHEELARWRAGFSATRSAWLERAALMGDMITVRPPSGEQRGVMRGIDEHGRLQLETTSGYVAIDAGDVFPV
jgi:BirA family biotin operon repressor/biotin-[acetyl-CoA-carboxylase] ligase